MNAFSKIALGAAVAAVAGVIAYKTSPAFAAKVTKVGEAAKNVFSKGAQTASETAQTATATAAEAVADAAEAVTETAQAAAGAAA